MNKLFKGMLATTLLCTAVVAQLKPVEAPVAQPAQPAVQPMANEPIVTIDAQHPGFGGVATTDLLVYLNQGAGTSVTTVWTSSNRTHNASKAILSVGGLDLQGYYYVGYNPGPAFNMTAELWTDDGGTGSLNPISAPMAPILGTTRVAAISSGPSFLDAIFEKFAPGILMPGIAHLVLTADLQTSAGSGIQPGSWMLLSNNSVEVGSGPVELYRSTPGVFPPPWVQAAATGTTQAEMAIWLYGDGEACGTCFGVGEGSYTGSIVGSAGPKEAPYAIASSCGSEANDADWYCYTATCNGAASATTCSGPADDTTLQVFVDDCAAPLDDTGLLACDDDACGYPPGQSTVSWLVSAGTTYRIRVNGWGASSGLPAYQLDIACTPFVCGNGIVEGPEECDDGNDTNPLDGCHGCQIQETPNELCAGAVNVPITLNGLGIGTGSAAGDNSVGAVYPVTQTPTCGGGGPWANDLWYSFVATHTSAFVQTCNSPTPPTNDTVVAVYDGACGALTSLACNDDACGAGGPSSLCVQGLTVGNTYYVQVSSWRDDFRAPFLLEIETPCPAFQIGACCDISLGCVDNVDANTCAATGVFAGIGVACGATQSCCFAGTCFDVPEACCGTLPGSVSAPGACVGDPDADGIDTTCGDNCPAASNPLQEDGDSDGYGNACDNCPAIANAGQENADGDSCGDACDGCPANAALCAPGICGCDTTDTDGDGTLDCVDGCPADPGKTAPGQCGCGVADTDSDGDGTANCNDGCPNDPNKIAPGTCGCGVADTDSDGDGTPNCNDQCPNDPNKIAPGQCGCGVSDADNDVDGVPNCLDGCPNDPNKTAPGVCGCGSPDTDSDNDGVLDCNDICPGADDTVDANGNGVPDCTGEPIPTVSEWGLVIMTLLLLTAGKVYFGNRRFSVVTR